MCKTVNGKGDLNNFIRGVNQEIKNNPQLTSPNLLPWRMHSFTQPCILDSDSRVVMVIILMLLFLFVIFHYYFYC